MQCYSATVYHPSSLEIYATKGAGGGEGRNGAFENRINGHYAVSDPRHSISGRKHFS